MAKAVCESFKDWSASANSLGCGDKDAVITVCCEGTISRVLRAVLTFVLLILALLAVWGLLCLRLWVTLTLYGLL